MKKFFIILIIAISTTSSVFAAKVSLGFAGDITAAFVRPVSVEADLRIGVLDGLRIRLPITFDKGEYRSLAAFSLSIEYSPFKGETGMFIGLSAATFGFLFRPGDSNVHFLFLNDIYVGFRQSMFSDFVFIETRLVVRDPFTIFSSSINEIKNNIPSFSRFKFRLSIGFNFEITATKKQTKKTAKATTTKKSSSSSRGKTSSSKSSNSKSTSSSNKSK